MVGATESQEMEQKQVDSLELLFDARQCGPQIEGYEHFLLLQSWDRFYLMSSQNVFENLVSVGRQTSSKGHGQEGALKHLVQLYDEFKPSEVNK